MRFNIIHPKFFIIQSISTKMKPTANDSGKSQLRSRFIKVLVYFKFCFLIALLTTLKVAGNTNETFHISRRVTNNSNTALSGVSVKVKGTRQGTTTDAAGNFDLNFSVSGKPVILFSYIGFDTKEVTATNNQTLNIALVQASGALNDVVVIGYGKQKKTSSTAAYLHWEVKTSPTCRSQM